MRFNWPNATHDDMESAGMFADALPFVTAEEAIGDLRPCRGHH